MNLSAELQDWAFLIGRWRGENVENAIDEGTVVIDGEYDFFPSEHFIRGVHIATNETGLVNRSVSFMSVDAAQNRFLRKEVFSYGFVNNEISYFFDEESIRFDVAVEPNPEQFEGITWRSFLTRLSDDEIDMGLDSRRAEGGFAVFNRSRWKKL